MDQPVKSLELLSLKANVSDPSLLSFQNVSLQSDTALSCKNVIDGQSYVIQLNPRNPSVKDQHKINAEICAPHPSKKILALKGGMSVQIFDFDLSSKLKSFKMNENVEFMKWLDVSTLAVITTGAVFHVKLDADSAPSLIFNRLPNLAGCNIINYKVDAARNWCLLIGSKLDPNTNSLAGVSQTYNISKSKTQFIPAQAGEFITYRPQGRKQDATIMALVAQGKLLLSELDPPADATPLKLVQDIKFVDPRDVPVALEYSPRYGFVYVVTAMGIFYAYDVATASLALMHKIGPDPVFTAISESKDGGIICITRTGSVMSISPNPKNLVRFITEKLKNVSLAVAVASRANLSGNEELFTEQFEAFFAQQNYSEAARVAASSPNGCLRTATVIQRFKTAPVVPGQAPPIMQYLVKVLEITKLNDRESLELVMPVMQQGQKQLVQQWLSQDKLTASEELGDFLRQGDRQLALAVYLLCHAHEKVVQIYCELEEYEKIIEYSTEQHYKPPYRELFRASCQLSPAGCEKFYRLLYKNADGPLLDFGEAMDILTQFDRIKELTALCVEFLGTNAPSMSRLQTHYLEILLSKRPDVADALFQRQIFTQYDGLQVAHYCENAGLFHRALEHYEAEADILRCIVHTNKMTKEFICNYIAAISTQQNTKIGLECLKALAKNKANSQLCVDVCRTCKDILDPKEMILILENNNMVDGVYRFLQDAATTTPDKDLVFRFITSAVKMGQYQDVERVVRESKSYDPKQVKDYLKEVKIDPQSLMIVCDRHGYVDELIRFLYQNDQRKAIERYVTGFGHKSAPQVLGTLLDLEATEEFINSILELVKESVDVAPLVEEFEKRNRLRLLQRFLEDLVANYDNKDVATHSALAKIYVETNQNADDFLNNNQYYDTVVVGKFCEKRDPRRAVICYRRGQNDAEMIELTNKNSFFKEQAKYLVERKNIDLWMTVLTEENPNRSQIIDQLSSSVIPTTKDAEQVSVTVKAFRQANLPNELIELLEAIMLRKTDFSNHPTLQNLLLITAIQARSPKLRDYINRLDQFDGLEVAKCAIHGQLYEEAFEIYKKFNHHVEALGVLLNYINDIDRAYDYAVQIDTKEGWSLVAKGQLSHDLVEKAIDSYLKAEDPSNYVQVISACNEQELFRPLVRYLKMARVLKEQMIDSELVYSYAKIDALAELEEFINQTNQADLQSIGDRCFEDGMYNAARLLFDHIGAWSRLASTLVCLGQFQAAVDAAKKAQSIKTWKEVCFACIEEKQFRLAQICGVNIVVQADELEELVEYYIQRGYFEEIMALLDHAIHLDRTHVGMFTELGILYSKFKPEKLLEHIKLYHTRINIPQLQVVCERNLQWTELCQLHCDYDQFDSAATKMMEHIDAWVHASFKDIIQKVSNVEIYYKAVDVYLNQHPNLLCDLLTIMAPRIDTARVVHQLRRANQLPLIKPFLLAVQQGSPDIVEVNEAVNDLYLEEEDVDNLRVSIENYPSFDQLSLASRLEKHSLLRCRRLASWLYTRNKRYAHAVELSKKDQMYQDAMEATAASGDRTVAEELLKYFATEIDEKDRAACFAACLYTCYEILDPDLVMEVAWMNNLKEYAMPYFINATREYTTLVHSLQDEVEKLKEAKTAADAERQKALAEDLETAQQLSSVPVSGMVSLSPMAMSQTQSMPMGNTMMMNSYASTAQTPMGMTYQNMPNMNFTQGQMYQSPF